MRGDARCRAHRDHELGSRGAGAPPGNLNALQHGRYSHPFFSSDIANLAAAVIERPDELPSRIECTVHTLQNTTGDLFLTMVAFRVFLARFVDCLASDLFTAELGDLLHRSYWKNTGKPVSPAAQARIQAELERIVMNKSPENRLLILRKIKKQWEQLPEQGSATSPP